MTDPLADFENQLSKLEPVECSPSSLQRMAAAAEEQEESKTESQRVSATWSKALPWSVAVTAAVLMVGITVVIVIQMTSRHEQGFGEGSGGHPEIASDPKKHWRVTPVGNAQVERLSDSRWRLDRGEIYVESISSAPSPLVIETPGGQVTSRNAQFCLGSHTHTTHHPKEMSMSSRIARVLVLSGWVTLTNSLGYAQGTQGDLLTADQQQAPVKVTVEANSGFAFDLYRQLAKDHPQDNLFFSPYSVSIALAMTAEGARNETALEMGQVLGFPPSARRLGDDAQRIPWRTSLIHSGFASLQKQLEPQKDLGEIQRIKAQIASQRQELAVVQEELESTDWWRNDDFDQRGFDQARRKAERLVKQINRLQEQVDTYELQIANALWGEQTYPFSKDYVQTVAGAYGTGGVFPCDFKGNPNTERQKINQWVADKTANHIQDLLPEGTVDDLTRLVLTNAIYFKGSWVAPFKKKQTRPVDFQLADGTTMKADTMHGYELEVARFAAISDKGDRIPLSWDRRQPDRDGFQLLELPYRGGGLTMVVVAPQDPAGLEKLEARLTAKNVDKWLAHLQRETVNVVLPKFRFKTKYRLGDADAPGPLQRMGMVRAFTPPSGANGADFGGMASVADSTKALYISTVVHKAFIDVNEEGTEAAAATGVTMAIESEGPFVPTFKADRPFLFLIRDSDSGTILFIGRVMSPQTE